MTMFENLYYGNIHPNERVIKEGSEYSCLGKCVSEWEQQLRETLSDEEKALYERITNNIYMQMDISARESFVEGFRLGAVMVQEITAESKTQLAPLHPLR